MEPPAATPDARYARCIACRHSWVTDADSWGPGMTCPACAIPAIPHQFFGHYQIVREIASGGLGTVHEAIDSFTGRTACVKLLRDELFSDPSFVSDFAREAQIAASINHPNVVQVYEFAQSEGAYFLAMEFLDHGTLQSRMAAGPIPETDILKIALDVARGLQAASAKGLLHRDVKPGNCMIDSGGTVKLLDFGLSVPIRKSLMTEGVIVGTPSYMSPEQFEGRPAEPESDWFSLGCTVFELITGEKLLHPANVLDLGHIFENWNMDFILETIPGDADKVRELISILLDFDPGRRGQAFELLKPYYSLVDVDSLGAFG